MLCKLSVICTNLNAVVTLTPLNNGIVQRMCKGSYQLYFTGMYAQLGTHTHIPRLMLIKIVNVTLIVLGLNPFLIFTTVIGNVIFY